MMHTAKLPSPMEAQKFAKLCADMGIEHKHEKRPNGDLSRNVIYDDKGVSFEKALKLAEMQVVLVD